MLAVLGFRFELRRNEYQESDRPEVAKSLGTGKLFVFMGFNRSMTSKHSVQRHVLLNASWPPDVRVGRCVSQSVRPPIFQAHVFPGPRLGRSPTYKRKEMA
jgi:hypothetical protein